MSNRHPLDVVVAGHLCLDIIPQWGSLSPGVFITLFQPGRLIAVGPATVSTGGPVSNTGLALHRLGIRTLLMGKIGADFFGQAIQQLVVRVDPGLVAGMIVDPGASTSYTIVINPPGIDRIFLHYPGANDTFSAEDVRYDLLRSARLFHFGYPPVMRRMYEDGGRELTTVFRRAREMGVTTSLDMAFPDPSSDAGRADWEAILQATLPYVDIFLPSVEEILFMLRRPTYEALSRSAQGTDILPWITPPLLSDLSDQLLAMGVRIVGLKLGDRGFYLRTGDARTLAGLGRGRPSDLTAWADQEIWAPCFQVDVVGTTGAGDATIAGFLSAFLRGMSPAQAVTAAVAVGACNVEAADALGGIRSWEDTWRRVAEGWPRRSLDLSAYGWDYDPQHQFWYLR
ncbi:MAG: carbohydrate kinase family protein [Anaerolineae bacterium]|nr:carbohydrate kinase family protein [Anaerolineae bacterium]MDW8067331.1 carbohydrate kinase family protein [Anaerolineae bacterium]